MFFTFSSVPLLHFIIEKTCCQITLCNSEIWSMKHPQNPFSKTKAVFHEKCVGKKGILIIG